MENVLSLETEQQKLFNLKNKKQTDQEKKINSLSNLYDYKRSHTCAIRVPEGEEKEGHTEKVLKEIMAHKLLKENIYRNNNKDINLKIQRN